MARRHALFVYRHSLDNGMTGIIFHESLLIALAAGETTPQGLDVVRKSSYVVEVPSAAQVLETKVETFGVILSLFRMLVFNILMDWIYCLWYGPKRRCFSDTVVDKNIPKPTATPPPEFQRTHTNIEAFILDYSTMEQYLKACRSHKTSFTALLHTIIQTILAADFYPEARVRFSTRLHDYRKAGLGISRTSEMLKSAALYVDIPLIWNLAGYYNAYVVHGFTKMKQPFHDSLAMTMLFVDGEPLWGQLGKLLGHNEFKLSNLGALADTVRGSWRVEGAEFCSAVTKACVEPAVTFSVASAKEGLCVINLSYEKGVLKEEMAKLLVERVEKRFLAVVEG